MYNKLVKRKEIEDTFTTKLSRRKRESKAKNQQSRRRNTDQFDLEKIKSLKSLNLKIFLSKFIYILTILLQLVK